MRSRSRFRQSRRTYRRILMSVGDSHARGKLRPNMTDGLMLKKRRYQMSDNKSKAGKQDRNRINVNEDYELQDWSKKFGVSRAELKKAVQKVGDSAEAVRKHLGK